MNLKSIAPVFAVLTALSLNLALAQNVTTYQYDNYQSGVNANETKLTLANVNSATFGSLFNCTVDGQCYAQPLYLSNLAIPSKGTHNVVFLATCHDSVYAFDADAGGDPIWMTSFLGANVTTVAEKDIQSGDISPEIGIVSTPVIDDKSGTLYAVAKTKETDSAGHAHYVQKIHALDVTTGAEKFGGPKTIGDTTFDQGKYDFNLDANPQTPYVTGTAKDGIGGKVYFNAMRNNQRCSLTLYNGVVYVAWSSHGDTQPYHGWVIGFDATTLAPVPTAIFCVTPDGQEGGIWQAGSGPVVDNDGNLYISCGNGTFDADSKMRNFGQCYLKFNAKAGLTVTDFFAPHNEQGLSNGDADMGSAGFMLADVPGATPHLGIGGGKNGGVYVLNRDSMGKFDSATDHIVQMLQNADGHWAMSATVYFNNAIFSCRSGDPLKGYSWADGTFKGPEGTAKGTGGRGGGPVVSAHGTADGIVWLIDNGGPASLIAYKADDLAGPNAKQGGQVPPIFQGRMTQGGIKFTHPVVINGKVYACCANAKRDSVSGSLCVFGLLADKAAPAASAPAAATPPASAPTTATPAPAPAGQ